MMRRYGGFAAKLALTVPVAASLLGCAASPPSEQPRISDAFVGYWMNEHADYKNWWEISPTQVLNYGIARSGGKCIVTEATIIGLDRIDIDFGHVSKSTLKMKNGKLLFISDRGISIHIRVLPSSICSYNGIPFEDAPYQ